MKSSAGHFWINRLVVFAGAAFCWTLATGAVAAGSGQVVTLNSAYGTPFDVYRAGDEASKKALVLVHDRWGLDDNIVEWADKFAQEDFFVMAVDLFDGRHVNPGDGRGGAQLMGQVDREAAMANLRAVVGYLNQQSDRKTAVIGWGYGAVEAMNITLLEPHAIISSVLYYGPPESDSEKLKSLRGPILGVFSNQDTWAHPQRIDQFVWSMQQARNALSIIRVDAPAGFMDRGLAEYDDAESERTWRKTLDFLDETLF